MNVPHTQTHHLKPNILLLCQHHIDYPNIAICDLSHMFLFKAMGMHACTLYYLRPYLR